MEFPPCGEMIFQGMFSFHIGKLDTLIFTLKKNQKLKLHFDHVKIFCFSKAEHYNIQKSHLYKNHAVKV